MLHLPLHMQHVGISDLESTQVDITMKAAKESDAQGADQNKRESIRVARTTRELIKIFSAAYNAFREPGICLLTIVKTRQQMGTAVVSLLRKLLRLVWSFLSHPISSQDQSSADEEQPIKPISASEFMEDGMTDQVSCW